ncbi:tyrosine--tRNA ligase [Helcobacillus massiliensis]|uniref:Tyrosine--tRNA ligase n=1 Tax=Helcobacillus massiliensis TaxID=521392 RepID=A0A839QQ52_9MICO|nr:tyrosine--tRNA ligase [Helcobacillus massiliensis]MBB3021905.1 tyrosyl-tRNA synthetase [Helcobacillus massiliensis]MCT1557761.1 tyrosine--tRNA ligase [Helcobacillus massiliensis]MCT2037001.1 tyrosine--tRNA ligase [Helcobacillus massiliensis]MCT2332214.1 tyrosine--tRNA ligase [Helcobacillus massiliensis]
MSNIVDELEWRGLLVNSTGRDAIAESAAKGPLSLYCGFDPTAASLHVGHLTQVLTMRRFQLAGHKPYALVGGATGLIGDPRMSGERVMNSADVVGQWVESLRGQIEPFLDTEGEFGVTMVNNLDWVGGMNALEFLRDYGSHFRMGTMLSREIVAARLRSDEGLSYLEFSYQILQGLDFLELYRRHGVTLQFGGNDQWGNIVGGADLIRRVEGVQAHAMTTPLVTKADGTKFGKSEGGAVWLDPELTSPYAFHQFWLNADDRDVMNYLRYFTFRDRDDLAELEEATAERSFKREAQTALADDLTTLVHGEEATAQAKAAAAVLFGRGDVRELDDSTVGVIAGELPTVSLAGTAPLIDAFTESGLVESKGAARRALKDGGLSINGEKLAGGPEALDAELGSVQRLAGGYVLLRRGKKNAAMIRIGD